MLTYKTALLGLKNRFEVIDESWTSITCWKCNTKGKRPLQRYFKCLNRDCLWRGNADINGAINIAKKIIKKWKLTQTKNFGVRGLGKYLPVIPVKIKKTGKRKSVRNTPKARSVKTTKSSSRERSPCFTPNNGKPQGNIPKNGKSIMNSLRNPLGKSIDKKHAGANLIKQSSLIEWYDQNDPSAEKDMETLSPMKSVDRGAGKEHVSLGKEDLVNSLEDGDV